ncbi:hypothetical protein GE21DRAFT_52 [Neurospora crassa]|uniref:Uncharacterized protein n=1 Tax=Neurospora crassa (strain ATCC 24698 / 74-OR23-1A / CBS 708.71 / DSM 1257 / FGSC 987) TaxID=367110 RepID=Q7SGK1_NEUCR|nr:hypothetical protein NCU08083 [Neurospora crassa OR74A]EAA35978.2 hypothetical protein NCU08083 [Neurospora crassa OR74A]KHE84547.1 hypothetical protein GE21DRAFT_52 [Neurospora crassa]|eukprot:XP_965214.2 hypothetical protein NCU08083 [Neurospora crassa OR74A]
MHPQLLFRLRLLLCVLLGVSAALVLPNRNPISRDTPELINVGSSNEASPESTTIYFPDHVSPNVQTASTAPSAVESSGEVSPNNNKRGEAHSSTFQQSAAEAKIARDDTKEAGSIYRRDGGGSNMTIIYIIVPILAVGLLIAGCICLRKCQGH